MDDSRGYSLKLYKQNQSAPSQHIGVQLGRVCITNNVPTNLVSDHFGVSKNTIYSWFYGKSVPRKRHHEKIASILEHGSLDAGG